MLAIVRPALLAAFVSIVLALAPTPTRAQDDGNERWVTLALARPVDGPMFTRLVRAYRERDGNTDALVTRLEELTQDSARAFAAQCLLGHLRRTEHAWDGATAAYEAALAIRANDPVPLLGMARIARERGQLDEAARRLEAAYEAMPEGDDRRAVALELGRVHLARHDDAATERWFDVATRGRSRYERGELARAYAEAGDHARAVQVLTRLASEARGDPREQAPALRDLGMEQIEAGLYDAAIATLQRAEAVARGDTGLGLEIHDALVSAYRRAGRLAAYVDELTAHPSRDPAELARLASLEEEVGRDESALETYRQVAARAPHDLESRSARIRLLLRRGRIDDALSEESALVALAPREARFVVPAIERLMALGRLDEGMAMFDSVATRAGSDVTLHASLADLADRIGDADRLYRELETLVRIEPREPSHRIALATERLARGDREAALALLDQALRDANDSRALVSVAEALSDRGFLREADAAIERAIAASPNDLELLRARADILDPERRPTGSRPDRARDAEALATWRRVLVHPDADEIARREARRRIVALETRNGDIRNRIAEWMRQLDAGGPPAIDAGFMLIEARERERPLDPAAIERVARRLTELSPREVAAWLAVERSCTLREDHACAIEALERLVDLDVARADTYYERLIVHAEASYRDDDAIRYARQAVERSPNDARTESRLGELLRRRGDAAGAIAAFRRALERDERRYETWLSLAQLLVAQTDYDGAARAFERVLRFAPDDDVVARTAEVAAADLSSVGRDDAVIDLLLPQVAARPRLVALHRVLFAAFERRVDRLERRTDEASRAELTLLGTRGLAVLLEALAEPDADRAARAARLLGRLRATSAVDALMVAVSRHPAEVVRREALVAAASMATRERRDAFFRLFDAPERRTRVRAAFVYAALGTTAAERARLREHPDSWVRGVFVLASIGEGETIDSDWLVTTIAHERDASVRATLTLAMGMHGRSLVAPLRMLVRDSGLVGDAARVALARIDTAETDELLAVGLRSPNDRVRRNVLLAHLGRAGAPLRVEAIPAGLDLDGAVRACLEALERPTAPATPRFLDAVATALSTGTDALRVLSVASELATLAPSLPEAPRLGAALEPLTRDERPVVRAEALRLLARLDPDAADRASLVALADVEPRVVRAALLASSDAGVRAAGPAVASLLASSSDLEVRRIAADRARAALARDLVAPLREAALHDAVPFVRESAVRSLRALSPDDPALLTVERDDPEPRVRAAAAGSAGRTTDDALRHDVDVERETRVPMRSRSGPAGDRSFDG